GNGTEDIFWDDPAVLFLSLHQYPLYPGTGRLSDIGGRAAQGLTIDLPLPAGSGDAEYLAAWDQIIAPAARWFKPDLLLVSAGYDALDSDPLAGMKISRGGFGEMARRAKAISPRWVAILEGGYDTRSLGTLAGDLLRVMAGADEAKIPAPKTGPILREAERVLSAARQIHATRWES